MADDRLIYIPDLIQYLKYLISSLEWEEPDNKRLPALNAQLIDAQSALERGELYLPTF